MNKMCLRPHLLAFIAGSTSRDEQNASASLLNAASFPGEKGNEIACCAQACRLLGKHLSEVTFSRGWKISSQSLGAQALEKSEKLTTSVADLLVKLIRFFMALLKATGGENHRVDHFLVKPQVTRLLDFCINKSHPSEGARLHPGPRGTYWSSVADASGTFQKE